MAAEAAPMKTNTPARIDIFAAIIALRLT